jgi:O-antigen ligase
MPSLGGALGVTAAGVATGMFMAAGMHVAGPKAAIAPAIAVLGLVLLRFPGAALALMLSGAVLFESTRTGILPPLGSYYNVAFANLTPPDILLLIGLGGVLLRFAIEGERPRLPDPLTVPLILLAIVLVGGVVTGLSARSSPTAGDLLHRSLHIGYVILVPLLTVNVLRDTRALKVFMALAAALAAFKGLSGVYASLGGVGEAVEGETISYLSPLPNLLMLVFALGVVAALIRRTRLPGWMIAAAPVALLALILSYRRSFWIAAAFTLVVVVIIASRRRSRWVLAIGAVTAALALVLAPTIGASDPSASPLVERAQTLSPSGLEENRGDRYRTDERDNVIQSIEHHPLTGIGLGVPWEVRHPLAEAHDRRYAHVAVLWYWLAFGPFGAIAYLALIGTALGTAVLVWRRHPDSLVKVGAIAAFGAFLALLVVELTATFVGVEPRVSLFVGAGLGWLAAAWRDIPREPESQAAS